jgi:hypothetical protein
MRIFYGIQWWLQDNSDFRELDGFTSLKQAKGKAKQLSHEGKGYHSFMAYAYHAELVNDDFWEDGKLYPHQKWQRVEDDFEKVWLISPERRPGREKEK